MKKTKTLKMIGQKFNKLTVLEVIYETGKRTYLKCLCDCGKEKICRSDSVKKYLSCGCHAKRRTQMDGNKNPSFSGYGEIGSSFIFDIKRSAKRRNIEFDLTAEYLSGIFEKQNKKCVLTGVDLYFGRIRYYRETNASLDRIDSRKGYIEGNVQWVLKDINLAKSTFDQEYFIKLCNLVAKSNPISV